HLLALMLEAMDAPERARIHLYGLALFDGTPVRWATQGEAHLKQLIDSDPGNYFLWNRLGNLYKTGDAYDLALSAYAEALRRNEHDIESLHSSAEIHLAREEQEEAARYFHQTLLHARQAPIRTPRSLVRDIVRDALEKLFELHLKSD